MIDWLCSLFKERITKLFYTSLLSYCELYPDEDVEKLYEQIQKLIDNIPQRDFLGGLHPTYPKCVGKYTINKRGKHLVSNYISIYLSIF